MTIVLVHGNPETDAIWDPLRAELCREDVIALSPPGFGAPVPDGFDATSDAYVDWLAAEIEALDAPVDLVGHDWGGGHVLRLACRRPELVRSWASDIFGCFEPEYVWHDAARIWQTPGVGEQMVEGMVGLPLAQQVEQLASLGMGEAVAARVAPAVDPTMGRCILALYRSAAQPHMARWGEELARARARPGLALVPTEDVYTGGETLAQRAAARAGARVCRLEGLGHWWMCEDPCRGAAALRSFIEGLGAN